MYVHSYLHNNITHHHNGLYHVYFVGANPLYSITWFFLLKKTHLSFICELACRTSIIRGCVVHLLKENGESISKQSEHIIEGTPNEISGLKSIVHFDNITTSNNPIRYSAVALTNDSTLRLGEELADNIVKDLKCMFFMYVFIHAFIPSYCIIINVTL